MIMSVLTPVSAFVFLTFTLASLLIVANRAFHVEEDPRIDMVEEMLPHVNCGACGLPGCRPFAEALVRGDVLPAECTVNSDDERARIAAFLGVEVGTERKRVARLACAGGSNVARTRARYDGRMTCSSAALVAGGGKSCYWGCVGFADCVRDCDFDAITMDTHQLPVVDEGKCTACGDCVDASW
jgi:Na+-translocating ferredoxin:NAD+ oxidoreductase RNF subunit RnfB